MSKWVIRKCGAEVGLNPITFYEPLSDAHGVNGFGSLITLRLVLSADSRLHRASYLVSSLKSSSVNRRGGTV